MSNDLFHFPGGKEPKFAKDKHPLRPEAGVKEIAAWLRENSVKASSALAAADAELAASSGQYEFILVGQIPTPYKTWAKSQFGTSVANKDCLEMGAFSNLTGRLLRLTKTQGQLAKLKRVEKNEYGLFHDPDGSQWGTLLLLKASVVGNHAVLSQDHLTTLKREADAAIYKVLAGAR